MIAVARGGGVDRKPVICWPKPCDESDAVFEEAQPDRIFLVPTLNPYGRALMTQTPVDEELADEPKQGEAILDGLVKQTKAEIGASLEQGADGILYLLFGARGLHTSPMEYGGHFLERDREILAEIQEAAFNLIFVVGEDDAYLDFVSDLPAHAFGWDCLATGTTVEQMRALRQGALATNSTDADIELRFGTDGVAAHLELMLQESHVH